MLLSDALYLLCFFFCEIFFPPSHMFQLKKPKPFIECNLKITLKQMEHFNICILASENELCVTHLEKLFSPVGWGQQCCALLLPQLLAGADLRLLGQALM